MPGLSAPVTGFSLHCSEPAFRAHFDEIILAQAPGALVERVSVPGGPWWLAQAAALTEGRVKRVLLGGRLPAREAVEALLASSALKSVILVGHQDCAWYERLHRGESAGQRVRRQGQDMFNVRDEVRRWSPKALDITGFMLLVGADGAVTSRQLF